MSIEFKSPDESQATELKAFGEVIDAGIAILHSPDHQHVAQIVAKKLQEALMWFTHGVINRPGAQAAEEVASVALDVTETVIENPAVE